jgi:hypothetical protein
MAEINDMNCSTLNATESLKKETRRGRMNQANGAHSFVGGGCDNVVDGSCSSIFGGYKNYVAGDCSVILGGANNNDMGMAYVGIFGNSINAVAPNTFHVNCLNAVNTPPYSGLFPAGTISWKTLSAINPLLDKVLVIS